MSFGARPEFIFNEEMVRFRAMSSADEPVMFLRHGSKGLLGERWVQDWIYGETAENTRISIHYQDIASFASEEYTHRSRRIKRFEKAAQTPTIAVVAFSEYPAGEKYITRTIPDTREIIVLNDNAQTIEHVESVVEAGSLPEVTEEYRNESGFTVVKTIQVEEWETVRQETHKVLWGWHTQDAVHNPANNAAQKEQYIRAVYHGDNKPLIRDALNPREEELMAEKYLRETVPNFRLSAPRGGELRNIDILGTSSDAETGEMRAVLASVTSSTGSHRHERIQTINDFSERDEVYYFDAEGSRPDNLDNAVEFISLDEVFDWMNTDGTRRQRALYTMLGLEGPLE
jgi:hypothetical protein